MTRPQKPWNQAWEFIIANDEDFALMLAKVKRGVYDSRWWMRNKVQRIVCQETGEVIMRDIL